MKKSISISRKLSTNSILMLMCLLLNFNYTQAQQFEQKTESVKIDDLRDNAASLNVDVVNPKKGTSLILPKFQQSTSKYNVSEQQVFIVENSSEDKKHPEYGKVKLENSPASEEIMGMRTANSRTYKNPDGTYSTQQTFGTLHYKKDGNYWVSIDNVVSPLKGKTNIFSLEKTGLPIYVDTQTGLTQMQLSNTGDGISFGQNSTFEFFDEQGKSINPIISKQGKHQISSGNTVELKNAWNNIDRRQTINYWQVKTDYIINQKPNIDSKYSSIGFTEQIELPKGWSLAKGFGNQAEFGWQGELLILDSKGAFMGTFELPVYFDSSIDIKSKEKSDGTIEGYYIFNQNDNIVTLTTIVPSKWLLNEKRVFPVTIDPTVSNTYSAGNLPTDDSFQTLGQNSTCPGSLTVTLPIDVAITSVDVAYNMRALNNGYMSEQRSQLRCVSTGGESEATITSGVGNTTNSTYVYNRTNLTIANNVKGGGAVAFELHAGRTWSNTETGCNTTYNMVVNNTWVVTVTYATVPVPTSTCSTSFFDTGGAGGNYGNNEAYGVTYQSSDGRNLRVNFSTFNIDASDYLRIYDGIDFNAPIIGQYNNSTGTPGTIVSSGSSITFLFFSNATTVAAGWDATIACIPDLSLYSYQNGNWESATTWTTDPSGTIYTNPLSSTPGTNDKAVILNGRTVNVTTNTQQAAIVQINSGATLDLFGTTGHAFNNMSGEGLLRLSSGSLPSGNMSSFVAPSGGTVEYYGASNFTFDRNTFNHLILNLSNASAVASTAANFTVNGNLSITRGDFRIANSATARTLTAYGDITLESNGRVSVFNGNAKHDVYLHGDLTNNGGSFKLHNLAAPSYTAISTTGYANLQCVNPIQNQTITANGPLEPYWIVVNKGSDQTYIVDVQASGDFFKLFGHTFDGINNNINLINGTLKLGSNIVIPQVSNCNVATGGLFWIPEAAHLWIDGAQITSTILPTYTRTDGLYLYGKLTVSGGSLTDNSDIGLILRETGVIVIEGGIMTTSVIRPSVNTGIHRGTYIQSGGTVNILRDVESARANGYNMYASFSLPYPDNVFQMTGGELNILNSTITGNTAAEFSLLISSNVSNISITGGDINVTVPANRNAKILSLASLYNLNIISTSSTYRALLSNYVSPAWPAGIPAVAIQPLAVKNNFSIFSPARFDSGNQNVTVGGNFNIEGGATYIPGTNSTIFNGSAGQAFTNAGTITTGLYNLSVTGSSITSITNGLTVRNNVTINEDAIFRDMGQTVDVAGNITNDGSHESQTGGSITLIGTTDQTINGNGSVIFGNLKLNKATGTTTLTSNATLTGNLRLANTSAVLDIGSNQLVLGVNSRIYDALLGTTNTNFSATRMVQTNGNQSDGGLKYTFGTTTERLFPIGVLGKYTPAKIQFESAPTQYGSLSVRPVNNAHPHRTSTSSLNYYWRVTSEDFTGIPAASLKQKFYYLDGGLHGGADEALYIPGVYNPAYWLTFDANKVSIVTNEILFDDISQPDGDFTAGYADAFVSVNAFFSRQNGDWSTPETWSNDPSGEPAASGIPTANDPVIIHTGHAITTVANNLVSGSLQIQGGGVLDLGTTTGHNFGALANGKIYGNGTLRISSATATAQFPSGDFGDFLGTNGGTIEYYTTGVQDFTIPPVYTGTTLNENFNAGTIPASWTVINANADATTWAYNAANGEGTTGCANLATMGAGTHDDYLISPQLFPIAASNNFVFRHRRQDAAITLRILVSTSGTNVTDFSEIATVNVINDNTWRSATIDLSSYINTPIYIAIRVTGTRRGVRIDNVTGPPHYIANNSILNYNNLIINPAASRTITLGQTNLQIYGNVTAKGAGAASINSNFASTIVIDGSLNVTETATLQYPNYTASTLTVKGHTAIDLGASLVALGTGTAVANRLNIYGNLTNNGTLTLQNGTGYTDIYFLGSQNTTFSGTGTNTFYRVYVDKGTTQTPLLNVTANSFVVNTGLGSQPLFVNNGTIRFSGAGLTTTLSTNYLMSVPSTGCLSVNGSTISIGSGANNLADLSLSGKLEVLGGTLNIGTIGNNNNNDIEYPGTGSPEILVSGSGTLNVNGQIRRSTIIATGSLIYKQIGGIVNIYGSNRQLTRALLEVLNAGSRFEMSDGVINLVQGVASATNPTSGELYLNAETHSVTGGTISAGTVATTAVSNSFFNIFAGNPIWNLHVNGETNAKSVRLRTFPITIKGDLVIGSIGGVGSTFITSSLDVRIGGNFVSNSTATGASVYAYGASSQSTIFYGESATQNIINNGTNIFRFGKLVIDNPTGIVNFSGTVNISVYGDLYINSGEFLQTDRVVFLYGNVYNYSIHSCNNASAYLYFYALTDQYIYGGNNPRFGSIIIRGGKTVYSAVDFSIENRLYFYNNSYLVIGDKELTFNTSATLTGESATAGIIISNGTLSDAGVTKEFSSSNGQTFNYRIGVTGKYTPVTMNITNTGGAAGTINIRPVNLYHPTVGTGFGNDELQYYWNVVSTGFGATPTVTHTYNYLDGDAAGTDAGYVGGRFYNYQWVPNNGIAGSVNTVANTITLAGVNYIDGEYTAGLPANFADKPTFYSRVVNGNWEDNTSWSTDQSGMPIASSAPNGNPVFIQAGHTITTSANSAYAYSVDIASSAVLNIGTTSQHNLGHVTGSGTIRITASGAGSFIFPGGVYTEYMNTSGSTVEYIGNGTLPSAITTYQNVTFSGVGTTKLIPAIDITVLGNLLINQGYLDNSRFNRNMIISGNWTSNISGGFIAGTGLVTFSGDASTINSIGGETFYNLKVNKAGGIITLTSPVAVSRYLYLTNGYFVTDAVNLLSLSWTSTSAVVGGSSLSFVDGPMRKLISSGSSFVFPVGNGTRYGATRVFSTITSGNQYWTAQYFDSAPLNGSNLTPPLRSVSINEYWEVTGPSGGQANVRVRWDDLSEPIPTTVAGRLKLRVAKYVLGNWAGIGQSITDGGLTSGTIQTTSQTSFGASAEQFTIGLDETATAQITGIDGEICDDGVTTLPVAIEFTGDGPWDLVFSINGVSQPMLSDIGVSPYPIIFGYEDLFPISGAGDYTIELVTVYDNNGIEGVILSGSATLTLKVTPAPIVSGANRVLINSNEGYSVPNVPNETYAWSVFMGTINGASNQRTVSIDWGALTGMGWVEVLVTNTVSLCTHTERLDVEIRNWPVISGEFTVCASATESYSSPNPGGHTYLWTVIGGTINGANDQNTVSVTWGTSASGSISVQQTFGVTETDTRIVTINPIPTATISVDGSSTVCDGDFATLLLGRANAGAFYTYHVTLNAVDVVSLDQAQAPANPFSYQTDPLLWTGSGTSNSNTYGVRVENTTTGCLSTDVTTNVTVFKTPETGPQYHIPN